MNKKYKERMKCADDAAEQFFKLAQKPGNIGMLQNDSEIRELYLKAFDIISNASEEEKDFFFNFTDYYLHKSLLILHQGEFTKLAGSKKSFTSKELKPIYDELTGVLDSAIEQNDIHKPAYIQRKADVISTFNEELLKQGITVRKSGCYIATTIYGSYDCPQVYTLRRFRDNVLANSLWGRLFIRVYYTLSPTLVKWFGKKKWFSILWQTFLDILICKLQHKGFKDTPYTDPAPQIQQITHPYSTIKLREEGKKC